MSVQTRSISNMSFRNISSNVFVYGTLIFFLLITIVPLYLIWSSAFKTNIEISSNPTGLPTGLNLDNFVRAWTTGNFNVYMRNSLLIATVSMVIVVICTTLSGYALSTLKVPGGRSITLFFLLGMAIPLHGILIPQFFIIRELKLINSPVAVIIILSALNIPFGTFLMRSYFMNMPSEIIDAAYIDGCNDLQVLYYVMAPIARPAISSLAVFIFMWSWNDLLIPLIYLNSDDLRTVSVGLTFYQGRFTTDYALTAAGTTIATVPVIIFYLLFQRQFVDGLTAGSLAGT